MAVRSYIRFSRAATRESRFGGDFVFEVEEVLAEAAFGFLGAGDLLLELEFLGHGEGEIPLEISRSFAKPSVVDLISAGRAEHGRQGDEDGDD
jgi:hypothetical protein